MVWSVRQRRQGQAVPRAPEARLGSIAMPAQGTGHASGTAPSCPKAIWMSNSDEVQRTLCSSPRQTSGVLRGSVEACPSATGGHPAARAPAVRVRAVPPDCTGVTPLDPVRTDSDRRFALAGIGMTDPSKLDRLPDDPAWGHGRVAGSGGVRLHHVRLGAGEPVLLLHGWPGFWYDWRRVLVPLSGSADVIAPDFRGFGGSGKTDLPPAEGYTPGILAEDVVALLDGLGISQAVVAAYDIGATVAQTLALRHADRVRALALFNPAYPGIGER